MYPGWIVCFQQILIDHLLVLAFAPSTSQFFGCRCNVCSRGTSFIDDIECDILLLFFLLPVVDVRYPMRCLPVPAFAWLLTPRFFHACWLPDAHARTKHDPPLFDGIFRLGFSFLASPRHLCGATLSPFTLADSDSLYSLMVAWIRVCRSFLVFLRQTASYCNEER